MRFPIYSLLFSTLVVVCLTSVDAHSSSTQSHARRSLSNKAQRRQGLTKSLGDFLDHPGDGIKKLVGDDHDSPDGPNDPRPDKPTPPGDSTESVTPSSTPASTSATTTDSDTLTSTSTTSTTTTPTITPKPEGPGPILSGIASGVGGIVSDVTSIGGGILSPVTSILDPTSIPPTIVPTSISDSTSDPVTESSTSASDAPTVTGKPTPTASDDPSTSVSTSASVTSSGTGEPTLSDDPVTTNSQPSSDLPTPTTTAAPTTTDGGLGGIITSIVGGVTSGLGDVTSAVGSGLSSILDPPTPSSVPVSESSTSVPVSDPTSIPVSDPTSVPVSEPPASAPTAAPSTTSDPLGGITSILSSVISSITSVLDPTTIISVPTSLPITDPPTSVPTSVPITDPPTSLPPTSVPVTDPPTSLPPTSVPVSDPPTSLPPTSVPVSDPPTSLPPTSVPVSDPPTSLPPTSVPVSDPPTSSPTTSVTVVFPTSLPSSLPDTVPSTTSAISVNSDLSFILTESSLAFASLPTSTEVSQTLTDPDQATTTISSQAGLAAATVLSIAPLPTGIPARIYPKDQLDTSQERDGETLISILFNQELNWPFVVSNQVSSSQIFAYLPVIIKTALNLSTTDVKTWALQVYVPSSYRSPTDKIQLGTMWLGYIPTDQVDILAAQIKAKQSPFYTGVPDSVARDLASHVNSGFSLNSVADPNLTPDGNNISPGSNGATSDSGKSRQDAIIGVVSALGAIALLVLVFLVYRSMKRRRELAHRRLSDPPNMHEFVGARPDGREFDQDSVGGARRRSFYYAEDSLRGYQGERGGDDAQFDSRVSPQGMSQRRNVMPAAISAPILRESSMNW